MRIVTAVLGIAALTLGVTVGFGQERPNGFFLTKPVGLSFGYDDNFAAESRRLDDSVTLLTSPTFSWMQSTHRRFLSLEYEGEVEMFSRHQELDALNHAAALHLRNQISARLTLEIGDSFLSTTDPTRRLINSLLLLPRGRYNENSLFSRLGYRLDNKTVVNLRFDQTLTTMELPEYLANRLDRAGFAGTLSVERTLTSRHSVSGGYAYLYVRPIGQRAASENSVHNASLGYIYTLGSGFEARLYGGVTRAFDTSFTGVAAIDKKFGDLWVSGGYQRYVSFFGGVPAGANGGVFEPQFANGLSPTSVYNVASMRAWGNLTRRIGLTGNVQRALNGVTRENRGLKSVIAQLRVDYRFTDRLTGFLRTEFYGQNTSEFLPLPLSRRRYFGGLEITLSRAPELAGDPRLRRPVPPGAAEAQPGEVPQPEERR